MSAVQEVIEQLASGTTDAKLAESLRADLTKAHSVLETSDPRAAEIEIAEKMAKVRSQNTFEGVLVAEAEALEKVEGKIRHELNAAKVEEARTVAANIEQKIRMLDVKIEWSKTLTPPRTTGVDRLAEIAEREETRRLLAGQPLPEFTKTYEGTKDAVEPHKVAWFEAEIASGFQTIKLRSLDDSTEQAAAMLELTNARNRRREARVPSHLRELQAELRARWTDIDRSRLTMLATGRLEPAQLSRNVLLTPRERNHA